MSTHSRTLHGTFRVMGIAAVALASCIHSFAQGTPVSFGQDTSVTLPAGWKILSQAQDVATQPGRVASTDPQASTLLLAAAPTDTKRNVLVSLFHNHFHGWGPPLDAGTMGTEAEVEKVLPVVLAQGFVPTGAARAARSTSSQNTQLMTIEINAKNAAGEERIFSDTVVLGNAYSTVRLFASRPASDPTAAQEIASMIQSLNCGKPVPGGVATTSGTTVNTPASTTPASPIAQTATAPPATTAPAQAANPVQSSQVVNNYHGALLMVEGQKGVGSGFVCNMDGHTYAITNAHVLSDNIGVKLTTLDGKLLTAGTSSVAVGHDIVKLEIAGAPKAFDVMTGVDTNAKIGDAVIVLGNAEGAQVVKPVEGRIVGIGPDLIEVDAPFVKGNSGSPIIHVPTGKVLGVATYLLQRKADQGSGTVTVETRRFGYRLDSVAQWQPINWRAFFAQSEEVAQIELLSEDFIRMAKDLQTEHHLVPEHYQSASLKRSIKSFLSEANHNGLSKQTQDDILRRFFADLRSLTRSDISAFNAHGSYDYFHRDVEDQGRFRDQLYETFNRLMQNHM